MILIFIKFLINIYVLVGSVLILVLGALDSYCTQRKFNVHVLVLRAFVLVLDTHTTSLMCGHSSLDPFY